MKWRVLIISVLVGLLAFGLGWFFHDMKYFADGIVPHTKRSDSLQKVNINFTAITQDKLDSLLVLANISSKTESFSTQITGEYVMKGANCAGLNFISSYLVTWTNEIDCHPDTLRIRWLDNSTFYTQDIIQLDKNCPPRVWIYQVVSFDGKHLILKDIWTGWGFTTKGDNIEKDERTEFIKQTKDQ